MLRLRFTKLLNVDKFNYLCRNQAASGMRLKTYAEVARTPKLMVGDPRSWTLAELPGLAGAAKGEMMARVGKVVADVAARLLLG